MKQGFTLLELLITIAILAVLTTVIVVAINPAESIKRARDTQRMSDLDNIKTGIILYISEGETDIGDGTCKAATLVCKSNCHTDSTDIPTPLYKCSGFGGGDTNNHYENNGEGWIPIDFTGMAGGAPLSHMPVDPVNTATNNNLYGYVANGTDFELNTRVESVYYSSGSSGKNKIMEKDGGNNDLLYEIGTDLTLMDCMIEGVDSTDCVDFTGKEDCVNGKCQ